MKLKRWLCMLLVLCMVAAVIPMNAVRALDVPKNTVPSEWNEIPFQVNPLYEGLIDPADYEVDFSEKHWEAAPAASVTYLSEKDAAAKIRTNMINRVGEFTVYVSSDSNDYSKVLESLMAETFKHTGKPKEGDSLQWQIAGYSGTYASEYLDGKYGYTFNLVIPYYTTAAQEKELDTAVKNLLNKLNVSSKSAYDKVKAVYDYVCANVTYDYDHLNDTSYTLQFTPYAALVKKTAVCQGYALLMYRLMLELGVDIRLIAGIGGDEAHGWNIVKLDGYYYNLDSTWDAGMDEYEFFLVSRKNFPYHFRYLDYETFAFHKAYPMAESNYVKGTAAKLDPIILEAYVSEDIFFTLKRNGTLSISGTGPMPDYSTSETSRNGIAPWRAWSENITEIIINQGVTEIGTYNFTSMVNVKKLSLPAGLITIRSNAFENCASLPALKLPDGLKTIEAEAFENCEALTELRVPESVTSLSGFAYCTGLKKVYLYNSGTIGEYAFDSCTELKELVIGNRIEWIGRDAFRLCVSLETVTIPESVTMVNDCAFRDCRNLTTVYLKNSGVLAYGAFEYCRNLKNVHFLGNITTIGREAFGYCWVLEEITLPESLEELEDYVFYNSSKLKIVRFTGDAPEMHSNTFGGNSLTAYYPIYNETWTPDVLQDYGGKVTWIATCYDNHIYDEGVVTLAPTCTEKGVMTYSCVNCDKTRTESIPATGHTSGSSYVEVEPTCMSIGTMAHTCAVCNELYYEDIPMLPHTCEDGICTACGNSVFRLAGANRWNTALKVADEMKTNLGDEKFDAIIIASGSGFADALSGSYLSSVKNAPILLSWGQGGKYEYLDTDNIAYIQENLAEGGTVYILGGVNAVPELYEEGLEGYNVKRLGGANRFETNILILEEAGIGEGEEILVCTATNFADSLSASATGKPILLVWNEKGILYGDQPEFLSELKEQGCTFTIIGGENAVGTALAETISTYGNVERLAGENRFETSVLVARKYFEAPEYAVLAYAWNYPDGLCGGALAYTLNAPLVLTMTNYETQASEYIQTQEIAKGIVLGGETLISNAAIRTVFAMEADAPVAVK